jgi:hypothetical protein
MAVASIKSALDHYSDALDALALAAQRWHDNPRDERSRQALADARVIVAGAKRAYRAKEPPATP